MVHTENRGAAFDREAFLRSLDQYSLGHPQVLWTEQTGSTNDDAMEWLSRHTHRVTPGISDGGDLSSLLFPCVFGTDHQISGHGRVGRSWEVPPRAGLMFSVPVSLPEDFPHELIGWIPLVSGWCVAQVLREAGVAADVKWPNDVLVDEKKLCGILLQARTDKSRVSVVIGIGVNVSQESEELPVKEATSLRLLGITVSRETLLAQIVVKLNEALSQLWSPSALQRTTLFSQVRSFIVTTGQQVRVVLPGGKELLGTARSVDDTGALEIETTGRSRVRVDAADVTHVRKL